MKYATAQHQNISVWSRRAGLDMSNVDLDGATQYTERTFGNGRKAALRYALEGLYLSKEVEKNVARFVGCVTADMIYEVAYEGKTLDCSVQHFTKLLDGYESAKSIRASCLLYVKAAGLVAEAMLAARNSERAANASSLVGKIIREARG